MIARPSEMAPPAPLQPYSANRPGCASCTPSVEELPRLVVLPKTVLSTWLFSLKTISKCALPEPGKYCVRHSR